jgi:hypothetical protein
MTSYVGIDPMQVAGLWDGKGRMPNGPLDPMDPLDMHMSNGHLSCPLDPMDIDMSSGHLICPLDPMDRHKSGCSLESS